MEGKWIYLSGRVPVSSQAEGVISLKVEEKVPSGARKLVKIIKEDPYSLLTPQEHQYYLSMCEALERNANPSGEFTL